MRQASCAVAAIAVLAVAGCQHAPRSVEPDLAVAGNTSAGAVQTAETPDDFPPMATGSILTDGHNAGFDNVDTQLAWLVEGAVLAAQTKDDINASVDEGLSNPVADAEISAPDGGRTLVDRTAAIEESIAGPVGPPAQEQFSAGLNTDVLSGGTGENGRISDEQDFSAVSSRETIESDARRRREYRDSRLVFQPGEPPANEDSPNVARYAIETTHEVGTRVYRRFVFANVGLKGRCEKFEDDDVAQREFLRAGGPVHDRMRLDPDGDGFACDWTPDIYRNILR